MVRKERLELTGYPLEPKSSASPVPPLSPGPHAHHLGSGPRARRGLYRNRNGLQTDGSGRAYGIWLCFGRFPAEDIRWDSSATSPWSVSDHAPGLLVPAGSSSRRVPGGGQLDLKMGLVSLLSFAGGVSAYIVAIKFMQNAGIHGVALQSGIWFVVTAWG